jgi:hypothetical protein
MVWYQQGKKLVRPPYTSIIKLGMVIHACSLSYSAGISKETMVQAGQAKKKKKKASKIPSKS